MKKVLSVLLAAAMVMGMSVSAFAANFSKPGSAANDAQDGTKLEWNYAAHVQGDKVVDIATEDSAANPKDFKLLEGDRVIFGITVDGRVLEQGAPKNWILKGSYNEFVEDVYFANLSELKLSNAGQLSGRDALVVVVELKDDFNAKEMEEAGELVELYMYVWDTDAKAKSEYAYIHYEFEEYTTVKISDTTRVYKAAPYTYYTLADGINSAMVVFELDDSVLVTAKMWKGDKYMITSAVNAKWSKELSKQYDTDIEVITFNTELDVREVIFESAKDNKQVVAVVDGELVAVDSEFVTKYEVIDGVELARGYIADVDANEGAYALIPADLELIEVEEEATEEETKENPSTGANDFVGAAVALAVVSVAAAGALALKK